MKTTPRLIAAMWAALCLLSVQPAEADCCEVTTIGFENFSGTLLIPFQGNTCDLNFGSNCTGYFIVYEWCENEITGRQPLIVVHNPAQCSVTGGQITCPWAIYGRSDGSNYIYEVDC
jgi:hypothetical protein